MKRLSLASLALLIAVTMLACATTSVANSGNPIIRSVSPSQVVAGGSGFTLSVYGSGFVGNAVVLWNGSARATQYISKTQLQASISSADIQQAGSAEVTVTDQRGNSVPSNSVFVTIQAPPTLGVATSSLPPGEMASSYSATLAARGGTPPYRWGVASGSLPPGLALSTSTGAVTGTPAGSGQYSFTVQVQDSEASPQTATGAIGLSIVSPLQIKTTSLTSGQVQTSYQATVAATGGITPYSWSVILGSLPPGLALSASTGAVTGTPTASGQYSFTLQAQDSAVSPQIAISALNISIAAAPPQITTSALPNGTVQLAYSAPLAATGGTLPYSWSMVSGSLPPGVALSASTGSITGTPTASGPYSFTVQVRDSEASPQTASKQFGISVGTAAALQITSSTLPNGTVQLAYSAPLAATGGTPPYSWSMVSGSLPPGVALSASTGSITGTPTASGPYSFTVQVRDSEASPQTASKQFGISVGTAAALQITSSTLPNGTVQLAYSAPLAATGGTPPYSWSMVSGSLPPGVALSASTGSITGTPTASGPYSFTVQVRDSEASPQTASKQFGISVGTAAALQITSSTLPNGTLQVAYSTPLAATGGTPPYSWSVVLGSLPPGLALGASTAAIAGTPTATGNSSFTVQVQDSKNNTNTQALSISISPASGPVVITPSVPPAVNQGTTFQFTANAAGTWSCSGTDSSGAATACQGSIDPVSGLYTAPTTVTAQQSVGGYQVLPNNHIYNTRIDSLPVNSNSAAWIAATGSQNIKYYEISKPINYTNGSAPTESEVFYYTPANNGTFQIPAYPGVWPTAARIEGGWLSARAQNMDADHHLLTIDTTSGNMQDMYQYYVLGANPSCSTCTSQSGVKYNASSYALPVVTGGASATDAAGMYITPLILRLQEMEQAMATGGTINHALRFTLNLGYCASSNIWPATTFASDGGTVPFGARFRLKSTFNISGYSPVAQILLTQLKQYGIILADGGTGYSIDTEYAKWPPSVINAFMEIFEGNPVLNTNLEAVDESSLEISAFSGLTTANREIITFTRTSDSVTASTDVALTGVAVNFPYDLMQIQVGAPAQQLTALVNIGSVTWSMSPSVGTLSSTGLYTPPGSVSVPTTTTITATSTANPAVASSMTLNVFPAGPIRLVPGSKPGSLEYEMVPTNYTDTSSNVWYSIGDDGGYANDQGVTTGTSDPTLYRYEYAGYAGGGNDVRFDFIVPNGTYTVTYKAASYNNVPGQQLMNLELNGTTVYTNLDLFVVSGGQSKAWDDSFTTTVTNNRLSFVERIVNNNATAIGALQITP